MNTQTQVVSEEKLIHLFKEGISIFLEKEKENIINGVTERNLSGRLALYLENLLNKFGLKGYYSDPEYNRNQHGQVKRILDDEMNIVNIYCDIIVHSRGKNSKQDNLIAIEMKKKDRPQYEKDDDRKRLRALTKDSYDGVWSNDGKTFPEHVCGYVLGIYMEIDITQRSCIFEQYKKGQKNFEWRENF